MTDMKLYRWRHVQSLARYGTGTLIVMAATREIAVALGLDALAQADREYYSWSYQDDGTVDPDEEEEVAARRAIMIRDLREEPEIVKPAAVAVWGSE